MSNMIRRPRPASEPGGLARGMAVSRRAALLLAVAGTLSGCGIWDDWFGKKKIPLPGKREPVLAPHQGLDVDEGVPKVVLPPPVRNAAWPQAGGNPVHLMGQLAASDRLTEAWSADIGQGGGYRRKILAQPVADGNLIYTMDADAVVTAFDQANGARVWRFDTKLDEDRSTNVGGGLSFDQGTLYAVNGLAELVALDGAKGTVKWRTKIGAPGRSAPTVAEGRLYVTTIQDRLLALATEDGRQLWSHQAPNAVTSVLGQPAPAFAEGLVVAGFGSGELAALRGDSGLVVWTDSLAAASGTESLSDLSAIRGLPVISNGRVFVIGMSGLMVALDLHSGRRLWERTVGGEDSPWVAGDWMFIVSREQRIAAIYCPDGRVAWSTDLPRWENPEKRKDLISWFGPLLVSDRLIVAGTENLALAVSPYSGEILGKQQLSGAAALGPIVVAGTVFIVTDDGRLVALR
jgi:outer membrane protein assembly factor BamB